MKRARMVSYTPAEFERAAERAASVLSLRLDGIRTPTRLQIETAREMLEAVLPDLLPQDIGDDSPEAPYGRMHGSEARW